MCEPQEKNKEFKNYVQSQNHNMIMMQDTWWGSFNDWSAGWIQAIQKA